MFIVYSPEGRNFIGSDPARKVDAASKINPVDETEFEETMMELDKDLPERTRQHRHTHYALNQYQKQLDAVNDRHVIVSVGEIMTSPVITLTPQATFAQAWSRMQTHSIQHLPIVDDTRLVGICSSQNLLRHVIINETNQITTPADRLIIEIAQKEVMTTMMNVDVRRAAFVMTQYRIGALPVMSEVGQLIGIITRSDLIKRLAKLPPLEIYA
ncbi:MAG: CBS domain-containing protein [Thiomicrospira sp.]|jgi:acetoin utilization protein AcuB|nr:CBS domain-containing protein [Thiomicrospira sp.]